MSVAAKEVIEEFSLARFLRDGFLILPKFWPEALLAPWEQALRDVYFMQARKAGYKGAPELEAVLLYLEDKDQEAGYQVLPMLAMTAASQRMLSWQPLLDYARQLLGTNLLFTHGLSPFINLPNSKRLLYHWHSETCYYPKRRNFLNCWFPVLGDKHEGSGTMWFARGSHVKNEWQFAEYQGYDHETHGKKQHFIQYEIPEAELQEYEKVPVRAARGDLVVFARSLAHTSTPNASMQPSYATVFRMFNYATDLTLSGNPSVQPYTGQDYARPQ